MSVQVDGAAGVRLERTLAAILSRIGLRRWRIEPVATRSGEFELLPPTRRVPAAGAAWDLTYRLRDQAEVVHAEPLFAYEIPDQQRPPRRRAAGGGDAHHPETAGRYEWSLERANVLAAWPLFGTGVPGAGITIGHPDTGYTPHPELADAPRLLVAQGFDFDDDDPDPLDDLNDGWLDNPGHGTGTGSVIVSNRGAAAGNGRRAFVSGVAPGASLIPIRTTESVVLFSMRGLRRAIDHATIRGAHVISISLGGPWPSQTLQRAIQNAVRAGAIVLAAAGNYVRAVVFPAAFEEVIAVAASTFTDEPWSGSSRGDAVDITAPGASVWRAEVRRSAHDGYEYDVQRGSGTSFAVATTAGVAALWLSYHGWATLARRYGASNIAAVFKSLLQGTCRTPPGWDEDRYGPGIVDAAALLRATLPAAAPVRKLRDARRPAAALDGAGIEPILHLLPDASRVQLERSLVDLLHIDDRALSRTLQDVGDELAFQLVMHPALLSDLEGRARGRRAAVTRKGGVGASALARRAMSRRLRAMLAGERTIERRARAGRRR